MRFPSKEIVERVRKEYPAGTRVELVRMDDQQAPPIGTRGTVTGVDDTASIMVRWDNDSGLHVVYDEDECRKLHTVTTICYGKKEVWDSYMNARRFFMKQLQAPKAVSVRGTRKFMLNWSLENRSARMGRKNEWNRIF